MPVQHHHGSCQCGRVAWEVDVDLSTVVTCNCTRCRRLGVVLAFAPRGAFSLLSGEEDLTEYRFNTGRIAHQFCRHCGIQGFSWGELPDGTAMAAVNVNCLDGVEARSLPATSHDGASN